MFSYRGSGVMDMVEFIKRCESFFVSLLCNVSSWITKVLTDVHWEHVCSTTVYELMFYHVWIYKKRLNVNNIRSFEIMIYIIVLYNDWKNKMKNKYNKGIYSEVTNIYFPQNNEMLNPEIHRALCSCILGCPINDESLRNCHVWVPHLYCNCMVNWCIGNLICHVA